MERIYEKEQKHSIKSLARKLVIPTTKREIFNLYGAPKVGKTMLAKRHSEHFKNPFYLDCGDIRLQQHLADIANSLPPFTIQKQCDLLILDHFSMPALFQAAIDKIHMHSTASILLVSKSPLPNRAQYCLSGLDFEEYVSFAHSNTAEHLFNLFLLDGTMPEICLLDESKKGERKREILALGDNTRILQGILPFMGHTLTTHHLYTHLKKTQSISKDTMYRCIHDFELQKIVFFVPKLHHEKAPKKLYFWDFSLFSAISYQRNFVALFENMIFLELQKIGQPFYSNHLDFLLTTKDANIGFIAAPFLSEDSILNRIEKAYNQHKDLARLYVITLATAFERKAPLPSFVLPFWEFALGEQW
ncbi:MAG: hypothetical protein K2N12_03320 [Helicobacter sp.]|nr:hypothetical protein [Helicobacter sp.]